MKVNDVLKKTSIHFNISGMKKEDLLPIYNKLKEYEYTEENVFQRLGVKDIEYILLKYLPIYLNFKLKENTPLDRLIRLFLLATPLDEREMEEIFDPEEINLCRELGLISRNGNGYFSTVDLFPCGGGFFASDHRFKNKYTKNYVYPPGLDSYMLARGMIDSKPKDTLDLCTGSGIQAILASRFSEKVVGVDINNRALNFARFNALLNQTDNVEFLQGNLYRPVGNRKFDLILANPPFVPAPQQSIMFRDGEKSGEAILDRILKGVRTHIKKNGHAQIVTLLFFKKGETYFEKIINWLAPANFQVLVLASRYKEVEPYVLEHVDYDMDYDAYSQQVTTLLKTYQSSGIEKLADGLISMRYTPDIPSSFGFRDVRPVNKLFSKNIKSFLDSIVDISHFDSPDKLRRCNYKLSGDIDFFWEGRYKGGKRNWGVLFNDDSLSIDESLGKLHWIVLDIVSDGTKNGTMIEEELHKRASNIIEIDERLFFYTIQRLLQEGILEKE
ncbi:MAG: methyltransferase [Candidatus Eremiobacteraeota bacterium]|nr:methyltransferase [Candidatus Eremiobacteraeota bacterium]